MKRETSYPSRQWTRLRGYDYSAPGMYFVTLCTADRRPVLAEVLDGSLIVSRVGEMVKETWESLPTVFRPVEIDEFIIMPNHVHGLIRIKDSNEDTEAGAAGAAPLRVTSETIHLGVPPLPEIIRRFKSFTANRYRRDFVQAEPGQLVTRLWQRDFYERTVRNERELAAIRKYIVDNPQQWELDRDYVSH